MPEKENKMDETTNEIELEEELEEDSTTEETESAPEEPEAQEESEETLDNEEESVDAGLDYDEEGDVIIPEDDETDEADDNEEAEKEASEEYDEPTTALADEKDEEISRMKRERKEYEDIVKDVLSKLGIKAENTVEGLAKFAAEAEETTPEEYLKKRRAENELEEAKRLAEKVKFEEQAKKDLAEIHAAFPETKKYKTILAIPNLQEFASYRDKGLSAKKAYIAANPDSVRTSVAEATKRQSLNETKNHLKSNVPKGSKDTSPRMTRSELESYRDLFPDLSDKEISELYRGAKK